VKNPIALVLEESEINPHAQTMTTLTRNITHARMMQVEEWQTFRVDPNDSGKTQVKSEARIISKLGWGLTERIERFGVRKFADNTKKVSIQKREAGLFEAGYGKQETTYERCTWQL